MALISWSSLYLAGTLTTLPDLVVLLCVTVSTTGVRVSSLLSCSRVGASAVRVWPASSLVGISSFLGPDSSVILGLPNS